MHRKIRDKIRASRKDSVWLSCEDVSQGFKPLKMGLRTALLMEPWNEFVETYDRVLRTSDSIFNVEVSKEEREADLDNFRQLRDIIIQHGFVQDTISLLNAEIQAGKRILVEDCSSTTMDVDSGIYPYTDSFHTTTGAVCTGLGIPEEAIETTIGVFSAVSVLNRAFLQNIKTFPTKIDANTTIEQGLAERYKLPASEFAFGWTDLNLVLSAERMNKLSSVFLTHLDLLDDLDEIKVCTSYKSASGEVTKGRIPATIKEFGTLEANYEVLKGWKTDTRKIRRFDELPDAA